MEYNSRSLYELAQSLLQYKRCDAPEYSKSHELRYGPGGSVFAALEERVYTLEDAFVNFEDDYLKANTDQILEDLTGRLKRVEDKLDILLEKIATRA